MTRTVIKNKNIYVIEVGADKDGEFAIRIGKIPYIKYEHGVLTLKEPHPHFGNSTEVGMAESPAFTARDAVIAFSEGCKVSIEVYEESIKRVQALRELAGKALQEMGE